jgi:single-stranded DNA-specific DHH superfamily exonuclease
MTRFQNSLSVAYEKQKYLIDVFDEALKNEENVEKELKETKIALEKIELKMKEAIAKRKKIQEEMRISALKTAHGLRDPGNIIFSLYRF